MSVVIRPIAAGDIKEFHRALDSVARERRYLLLLEGPTMQQVEKFVLTNIERNVAQFVAIEDGSVVGWCDISPHCRPGMTHSGELGMGVIAGYRRRGIGYRLLQASVAKALTNGLTRIELEVFSTNQPAIALYKRFGFENEGIKRKARCVDGIWDDIIIMALLNEVK